jgi:phytoene dehydrogenase-like protein
MLCQSIESVATYERYGANVAEEWRILDEFLARQPEDIKRAGVDQRRRSKLRSLLLTPVGRMLHRLPGWEHLERLRGQYIYRGDHHGFQNMEQCGEVAPRLIAKVAGANANETSKSVGESYHRPAVHASK